MSDQSLFMGKQFVVPYDNKADAHASMMARAMAQTGTRTPGEVLNIGEMTLPIGITDTQLKIGNMDTASRNFDQLAAPAQDAIRRNIEKMYAAQATDSRR